MVEYLRILAVIPARGGSKRIPRKNVRPLGGKALITWSIDCARMIPEICDVLVSTDDREIAKVAAAAGASVPWLRPPELATDDALSVDVCRHALDWYEAKHGNVDGLLLLQPTSPFRSLDMIQRGIDLFREKARSGVVGVSPAASHPLWCFRVVDGLMRPFVDRSGLLMRSQDLPLAYEVNGAFYLIAPEDLRSQNTLFAENAVPLIIDSKKQTLDIDTEWDWFLAEALLEKESSISFGG